MNNNSAQTSANIDKNAWVICDSRSYPGLKFYVNKVTGVKVWNITESEIALAEKVGKVGPEPQGSPTMTNPTDLTAKIYNKQVINNQFSNQLSNLVMTASAANPYPSWDNHQTQPVNMQEQLFDSQGRPVNMQQQLFTLVPTAALTPLLNQAANLQNYQQLFAQSTNLHNNAPFIPNQEYGQDQQTPIQKSYNSFNSFNYGNNDWNEEQYHRQEGTFNHTKGSDLRRKLIKRRRSCSGSFGDLDFRSEKSTNHEMENRIESVSAPPLKLAPLKTLTASNPESNNWFIVVEKDVILENYTFLDDMVAADPDCHLVVPHHVLTELKMHVSMSSDVRPRRTLRFLTQQIENGKAMLGEPEEGYTSSQKTIVTCVKLATGNNVVILIAKYQKTLTFKSNIKSIHVFTMQAVKDILDTKSTKPRPSSPKMIMRSIPNNFNNETREPENNISRELFKHYGYYNQSEKNETLYTPPPPATKNGKILSRIIDTPPKPSMQPVSAIIGPESERKNTSLEKTRSTLETNSFNISKIDVKNPHKPAITNVSKGQKIRIQRTPGKNSPINSKIDGKNPHKQASNEVAPQISPTPTTKAVPCNSNAVDEEDKLSRSSVTYIGPTDPVYSNFHHTSAIKKPSDRSTEANKYSPTKPEFASPRKRRNSNWNHTGNKTMRDTMDSSSTSSTSISLDWANVKKIIAGNKLIPATPKGQIDNAKEITPVIERPKSASSCYASYDNDNTSEPSLKKTVNKNLAVVETSTPEIISNSESFNCDKVINPKKQDFRKLSRKRSVVMYEVACQSMEEVLRLRSEEWVFRFEQIMEEVLRVKLQERISYEHKERGPLNLQEAARCIIKKFDGHFDVVDAANKLSRSLYESSDETGKIINIEPSDYMELYSYGVFLVETFLDMMCADCKEKDCKNEKRRSFLEETCSCHEVRTASELLKKLLFDIQNANVETFADHQPEFLLDSSVDETTHDNFMTTRQQSSTEAVKMKMDEVESAEHVRRYPVERKQTEALDEITTTSKKTESLNCQQFTKKIDKAAKADEVHRKVQKKGLDKVTTTSKKTESLNCQQFTKKIDKAAKADEVHRKVHKKVLDEITTTSKKTESLNCQQFTKKIDKAAKAEEVPRKGQKKINAADDTAHYVLNTKTRQQSSTESVKMKMGEVKCAENVKRYPVKRKQTDTIDAPKAKKPTSLNYQQFANKIDKAAEADEVPRKVQNKVNAGKRCKKIFLHSLQLSENVDNKQKINGLRNEADVNVPPKVRNVIMGASSDSAFFSSLQLDKKDLNNAVKLKACNIKVECSNKADAPDEQKDLRSSPEEFIGLKCHFNNENNVSEISPTKVVCTFKRNEDLERRVKANWYRNGYQDSEPEENMTGEYNEIQHSIRSVDNTLGIEGMAANETFETIPVDNLDERTINGNDLSMEKKVHENEKNMEDDHAIVQDCVKTLTFKLAYVFSRILSLCNDYFMEIMNKQSEKRTHHKLKLAVSLLFKIHKALESLPKHNQEYNNETLLKLKNTDDRSLEDRHVIATCVEHGNKILKYVSDTLKI